MEAAGADGYELSNGWRGLAPRVVSPAGDVTPGHNPAGVLSPGADRWRRCNFTRSRRTLRLTLATCRQPYREQPRRQPHLYEPANATPQTAVDLSPPLDLRLPRTPLTARQRRPGRNPEVRYDRSPGHITPRTISSRSDLLQGESCNYEAESSRPVNALFGQSKDPGTYKEPSGQRTSKTVEATSPTRHPRQSPVMSSLSRACRRSCPTTNVRPYPPSSWSATRAEHATDERQKRTMSGY